MYAAPDIAPVNRSGKSPNPGKRFPPTPLPSLRMTRPPCSLLFPSRLPQTRPSPDNAQLIQTAIRGRMGVTESDPERETRKPVHTKGEKSREKIKQARSSKIAVQYCAMASEECLVCNEEKATKAVPVRTSVLERSHRSWTNESKGAPGSSRFRRVTPPFAPSALPRAKGLIHK